MRIITEYPLWFLLFCILAGVLYAAILYYRNSKNGLVLWLRWILASLRFSVITVLCFLLLAPVIKTRIKQKEKPLIIFAQDASQSLSITDKSDFLQKKWPKLTSELKDKLSEKFEYHEYTFGEEVKEGSTNSYNQKLTDISALLQEIETKYVNRNVGAVILATDGLYNSGSNPLYAVPGMKFPVYTIGLGDTSVCKDLIINNIRYNKLVYLGNNFPVEVVVNGLKAQGETSKLILREGKNVIAEKNIRFQSDKDFQTIVFQLNADKPSLRHYTLSLSSVKNEITLKNNIKDIFMEVIDGRQKILLLSLAPHPDISAIKQAIESNQNYEIEEFMQNEFSKPVSKYNLVILHQIPSRINNSANLLSELKRLQIPVLFILGNQSDITRFSNQDAGFAIQTRGYQLNEALPVLNNNFGLFTLSDELKQSVSMFPPLVSPFGSYQVSPATQSLFNQRISNVPTQYPLVSFYQSIDNRYGVIAGEGIWRWRLIDYSIHENHQAFDELMNKMVQYLSVKLDKSMFRIRNEHQFMENDEIEFDAELYNESYEPVNKPDISIDIKDESGKKYPYVFARTSTAYHLNAGQLKVGNYSYTASTTFNGKTLTQKGSFSISALAIEDVNLVADHRLLVNLSRKTGGKYYLPDQTKLLIKELTERDDLKTVIYFQDKYLSLAGLPVIFILLVLLLSVEWFVRKYSGII